MPRDIVTTVYTFDELSEEAKARAVATMADNLAGFWWDSSDNEEISDVIVHAFAATLLSPGHDTYGVADFPGINGVSLEEWELDRRYLALRGTLTRENAPALPWVEGIDVIRLHARRVYTDVETVLLDDAEITRDDDIRIMKCVLDALRIAMAAAVAEYEYKTGEECARERCENGGYEFHADGTLA